MLAMDVEYNDSTPLETLAVGAESLAEEEIEWVWPGRIPVGFLSALVGPRGVGKSLVLADVAARVTRGFPWPDDPFKERRMPRPASVLYGTAEDPLKKGVVPRLKKAGADLAKVKLIRYPRVKAYHGRTARTKEVERWRLVAKKVNDLQLIVIDGLVPLFGNTQDKPGRELDEFLNLIAELAEERNVGVLIANTTSKLGAGKNAGVDVVAHLHEHARMVWEIEANREKTKNKLLLPVQISLDDDPGGLEFKVHPDHGCVVWHEENVPIFAGSRPKSAARAQSQADRAVPWLFEYLSSGPVASATVLVDGAAENLGAHALRSAKLSLGVRSIKLRGKFGLGWEWELPSPYEDVRKGSPPREGCPKAPTIGKYWLRGIAAERDARELPVDIAKAPEDDKVTKAPNLGLNPAKAPEDDEVTEAPNLGVNGSECLGDDALTDRHGDPTPHPSPPPQRGEGTRVRGHCDCSTDGPDQRSNISFGEGVRGVTPHPDPPPQGGRGPERVSPSVVRTEGAEDAKMTEHPNVAADLPVCLPNEENQVGRPGDLPPHEEAARMPGQTTRPEWFDEAVPASRPARQRPEPPPAPRRPKPQHILDLEARMLDAGITAPYFWGGPEDFPEDFPELKLNTPHVSQASDEPGTEAGGALPSEPVG